MTRRILVPVDFSPCSDAALELALRVADESGAEVELLHVWRVREPDSPGARTIFADTPEGVAMEQRLTAADRDHAARVSGRLEFGDEPEAVILDILRREGFDMVVIGSEAAEGEESHLAAHLAKTAPCKVVTTRPPPPPASSGKIVAA